MPNEVVARQLRTAKQILQYAITEVDWNAHEVEYCAELVILKGDNKVPPSMVTGYLLLQQDAAVRDGNLNAAQALLALRSLWDRPPYRVR